MEKNLCGSYQSFPICTANYYVKFLNKCAVSRNAAIKPNKTT
jgi:hypothetical protein